MKRFLTPEGLNWYINRLNSDPTYRRKERRRVTYLIRYQTDGQFWLSERNRCMIAYNINEEAREKNRERCKRYRQRKASKLEAKVALIRGEITEAEYEAILETLRHG
jgi:hypothetical protein